MTSEDRDWLPSGRNVSSVADLWFLEIVNLRPSGGGISTFDSPALSSHGWSWTQLRFFISGLEVTDPARPGTPLLEIPHGHWRELRYQPLWAAGPRLSWEVQPGRDLCRPGDRRRR